MTIPRLSQKTVTQAIDVMQWTLSGDDAEAAEETRRQCRLAGPYTTGYLIGVVRGAVPGASATQRVRAAGILMEGGGFIKSRAEEFGVFREHPDAIAVIRMIDLCFERMAKRRDAERGLAADAAEAMIERCWKMMKRGIMRLYDPEADDNDDLFIQGAVTPGQRARARALGAKLYAVRQHIRRLQNAKMAHLPIQRTKAARGTPTPH